MSLARRIDYELARAREWRGGEFEPLPQSEAIEGKLDPGEGRAAVVSRARSLLGAPGEKAVGWLAALAVLLVLLAGAGGAQVARLALGDPADGPVNIAWFLGHALGLQTLLLALTLLVALGPRTALGRLLGRVLSLGGLVVGAAVRLASRGRGGEGPPPAGEALDRLRSLRALRPLAMTLSHGAWTAFNLGLLLSAAAILYAEHHAFAWQSTLLQDEARAERVLVLVTLPARIWPGAPTPEQVRASRFDPQAGGFVDDVGEPAEAVRLRQAWSTQLLASVAGFGLLPRALLLLVSWIAWRLGRRTLEPPPGDPYLEAVLARLAPQAPRASEVAQAPLPEPGPVSPGREGDEGPLVPQALAWLGAATGEDPGELLGPGWRSLPRLDSRRGERAALEALQRPAELALFCDLSNTPDASLQHWLREAAPARLHLVLTGGAAFRRSSRGASAEQVAARREVWELAARSLGADVAWEFDAGSATADSLRALRERFDRHGATGGSSPATTPGLEAALQRVREAARRWSESLAGLEGPELEAEQLRAAARIRESVEACFTERPAPALVGPAVVKVAKTTLRGAMEGRGLRDEAWSQALGEAARLGRLLTRVKEIDPRWSAAGLALGLVAGPLGGAIAAGSAGLVAGASLAGTLGPLGAALGSALSLKRRGGSEEEELGGSADALGLPARAGALRALELALQGRGEEAIAKALGALARSEPGRAGLDEPERVDALCDEAARIAQRLDEEGGEP